MKRRKQIAYILVTLAILGPIAFAIPTTMKSSIFIDNPPGDKINIKVWYNFLGFTLFELKK